MTSPRMNALVKPRGMWTGLITVERVGQPEHVAHQDRVLVGRDAVDDRVALADRLDEAGLEAAVEERREQPERERGLAAVHARGREVELAHRRQRTSVASGCFCRRSSASRGRGP